MLSKQKNFKQPNTTKTGTTICAMVYKVHDPTIKKFISIHTLRMESSLQQTLEPQMDLMSPIRTVKRFIGWLPTSCVVVQEQQLIVNSLLVKRDFDHFYF